MRSKKATVILYIIMLGIITGIAAFYFYNAVSDPYKQANLNQEIVNQMTQRDLEINNIRYYLKKSGELSLIDSIYSLAKEAGFYNNAPCGYYLNLPLYQSATSEVEQCMPEHKEELVDIFSSLYETALNNYPENLLPVSEYDFGAIIDQKTTLLAAAKQELMLPRKESIFLTEFTDNPFDTYEIKIYAEVECEESFFGTLKKVFEKKLDTQTSDITKNYDVKLSDYYTTEGTKFIFTDVRYPFENELKPEDSKQLIHKSQYRETDRNNLLTFNKIGLKPGQYCKPQGLNTIYNLELTTYKGSQLTCTVNTLLEENQGMGAITGNVILQASGDIATDSDIAYLNCLENLYEIPRGTLTGIFAAEAGYNKNIESGDQGRSLGPFQISTENIKKYKFNPEFNEYNFYDSAIIAANFIKEFLMKSEKYNKENSQIGSYQLQIAYNRGRGFMPSSHDVELVLSDKETPRLLYEGSEALKNPNYQNLPFTRHRDFMHGYNRAQNIAPSENCEEIRKTRGLLIPKEDSPVPEKYFKGKDIQTWDENGDNNEDNKVDSGCLDSPTYLQCPGIKVYYCGKTGYRSFSQRRVEFPQWEQANSGSKDIDDTFVWVYYNDDVKADRFFDTYLHAKTATKFKVDFDPEYTQKGIAFKRDKWYKWFQDIVGYGRTASKEAGAPTYVYKSFRPSFQASIDYDFSDYNYIKEKLKELIKRCGSDQSVRGCVSDNIQDFTDEAFTDEAFTWKILTPQDTTTASDTGNRYFAFEVTTNKIIFPHTEPISYKFAAYIKDLSQSPILDVDAIYPQGTDEYIILKLAKTQNSDVDHYNIFVSPEKIENYEAIKQTEQLELVTFEIKPTEVQSFEPEKCNFASVGSECLHRLVDTNSQESDRSLSELANQLICDNDYCYNIISIDKDADSYVYITAVDKEGTALRYVEQAFQAQPQDRLSPGKVEFTASFQLPNTVNIQLQPIGAELYYIFVSGSQENIVDFQNLKGQTQGTSLSISASKDSWIGVIAVDNADNPLKVISATGSSEGYLEISPEYQAIIHQLSNPQQPQ